MKPFVKVCASKVLRRGIVVCCGPKPAVRKLFLDPKEWLFDEVCWRDGRKKGGE